MAVVRSERRNRATAAAGDDQPRKSSTDFKKSSVPVSIAVLMNWRRHPDSNRGIRVLQTLALPLGYAACRKGSQATIRLDPPASERVASRSRTSEGWSPSELTTPTAAGQAHDLG